MGRPRKELTEENKAYIKENRTASPRRLAKNLSVGVATVEEYLAVLNGNKKPNTNDKGLQAMGKNGGAVVMTEGASERGDSVKGITLAERAKRHTDTFFIIDKNRDVK